MKRIIMFIAIFTLLTVTGFTFANAADPVEGYWKSIDEDSGKPTAFWKFSVKGSVLTGRIISYKDMKDGDVCDKCKGSFKNKPILKTSWLRLTERNSDGVWDTGYIVDTRVGKQYKAKVWVEDGNLMVRGYLGVAALGRTQVWKKATKDEAAKGL
ncbi:MAG: DUF2147 domain-containing protein [Spirochaetes bacterium]|nr:DUF2147 domain-containing protein [Spirochaetota bacterium]MBN2772455.1 DUF2147 domain-containing protein [Spirochaetota bacterium]